MSISSSATFTRTSRRSRRRWPRRPAYDQALVLGDLVGYGADPNAVIDRVRALRVAAIIRGNHDKVAAGLETVEGFNHLAREADRMDRAALTPENRAWLAALPQGPVVDRRHQSRSVTARRSTRTCTSSTTSTRCARCARRRRPLCLFGHTHVPAMFRLRTTPARRTAPRRAGAVLESTAPPRGARFSIDLETGRPLSRELRRRRPAARRRPARRVRHPRYRGAHGRHTCAPGTTSPPRRPRSSRPDCRTSWRAAGGRALNRW